MSTGFPNDAIDSNEFGPNPTPSVFEWLNKFAEFHGQVAIYGTWNVFENIFNRRRSGLIIQAGWTPPPGKSPSSPRDALLKRLYATTTPLDEEDVGNSFLQVALLDYVKSAKPRVLFVGYGETDNWAHQGRYDLVLDSAHRTRQLRQGTLGDHAGDAAVSRHHDLHHHHRSWPWRRADRVEGAWSRGEGIGEHLGRGDRPRHAGSRRAARTRARLPKLR